MTRPALELSPVEAGMLDGAQGPALAICMRIVASVAARQGATRLLPIESGHVDGCLNHGRAGLDFAEALVRMGGRVSVRTTLNVGSLDLLHPHRTKLDPAAATESKRLMDAYVALGCEPTWSCAPYQISHRPAAGSHVAWAESNAIAFVNSVLGARSERYGDFFDIAAALTGRVPKAGLHLDENRRADVVLDCTSLPHAAFQDDSTWTALGFLVGTEALAHDGAVVAIVGLPGSLGDNGWTEDRLKAIGATAASVGDVALFHAVRITPEAPDLPSIANLGSPTRTVSLDDLRHARRLLSPGHDGSLDAVVFGTPHFSVSEFRELTNALADGPKFHRNVAVYVSTSRAVLAEATRLGYATIATTAGAKIVTDTCTYVTPVLDPQRRTVMTNSGKWAWYAPATLGVQVVLGNLDECVASARAGEVLRHESA